MKRLLLLAVLFLLVGGIGVGVYLNQHIEAGIETKEDGEEPDMPGFLHIDEDMKRDFMLRRAAHIGRLRGVSEDEAFDPQQRIRAIEQMEAQIEARGESGSNWMPIGPAPIPNGQTVGAVTPVSGRTIAIAVHPTNANIVYVGTAQGGLYRSTDGGANWMPLLDNALSLAIGAVTIAPSQPDTVYVGTGEPNFSLDSFFGVGLYRIDNASSGAPIITGPLNKNAANADVFSGLSISKIAVDPANANNIFVSATFGLGGISGSFPASTPSFGLFRSTNAAGGTPTFEKLTVIAGAGNLLNFTDVVIDPSDANRLICVTADNFGATTAAQRGIYLSTNALAATPAFTLTHPLNTTDRTELAINRVGSTTTVYAASGLGNGTVHRSVDGGASFVQTVDNNFCNPQCFYDVAVAVDPTDATKVYLGGSPTLPFGFSTTSGASFTNSSVGLHVDSHAITVAPGTPTTIYFGSDGGIYKSLNSGGTWLPLNNTQFFATQFMGLDVHPTDANFTLGGTQDNGTNLRDSTGTWRRADGGDGGYTVIDQNAVDTINVRMYHTYFNQSNNVVGYATVATTAQAQDNGWTFRGCLGTTSANGITCADPVLFYAPLERGPGNPNTIYYGTSRLYRSANNGVLNTVVSQSSTAPISAIGIAPTDDNVRIIGRDNGVLFGTFNGSTTMTNLDPTNVIPNQFIGRAVIAQTDPKIAYVTLSAFGVNNVFRTTNLNAATPTWTPAVGSAANPLPKVPVSSFLIDPLNSNFVYAGTDIGVYMSPDGGANWTPFASGLPRIAVFGLEMAPGRIVRAATHGKGMYETPAALPPTAAGVTVSGRILTRDGAGIARAIVTITDAQGATRTATTDAAGQYRIEEVTAGQSYVFSVAAKNYQFTSKAITVNEDLENIDFTAQKARRTRLSAGRAVPPNSQY